MARTPRAVWLSVALLAGAATVAIAAGGQEEDVPRDEFSEHLLVTEVLLDVLVTDKRGHIVLGLGADDFLVEEEGKFLPVNSVTFYGTLPDPLTSGSERTDRYFVVFFHNDNKVPVRSFIQSVRQRAGNAVKTWVEREMLPNDQLAVISYDFRLRLHQDFTRDPEAIAEALDAAARSSRGISEPEAPPPFRVNVLNDSPSLFINLPRGEELHRRGRTMLEALDLVARAAEGIVGRKNMLFFSSGFDSAPRQGELPTDSREYRRLRRSLNTANTAVYSFDLTTIGTDGRPGLGRYGALGKISVDTGGQFYERYSGFLAPIQEMAAENQGYYLISYTSAYEPGTTGYRDVQVLTREKAHRISARRGYRFGSAVDDDG